MTVSPWSQFCLRLGDVACGWLLHLPRDLSLLALAGITATIMLLVRRWVANQVRLRAAVQDDRRLRRLIRRSRRQHDAQRVQQYQRTRARIARGRIGLEILPATISLLAVAVIVTWAAARVAYYPPSCRAPLQVVLYTPVTAVGKLVHLVPTSDIRTEAGWLREVGLDNDANPRRGIAVWKLLIPSPVRESTIQIRYDTTTLQHPLRVGQPTYALPVQIHGSDFVTRVVLQRYRPFSIVPDTRWFPAWSIAYLCFAALFFFAGKYFFRIY